MKVCLEFGVRGGYHRDNIILPSAKLANKLAQSIVCLLTDDRHYKGDFLVSKRHPRTTWTSCTHFVSVSRLPNDMGSASSYLWRKP